MADASGLENPVLEKSLLSRGSAFNFLQAYRNLVRLVRAQGGDPQTDIRIRPALSLELPRASVERIQRLEREDGRPGYELQTSFLGLYGASSPLPNFYTEDLIAAEQEDEFQARLLLDVFHQRIYRLYAEVLQKYQPVYELVERADSHFQKLLWSLVGARDEQSRSALPQPSLLLHYANLYGRAQRSSAGLHYLLSDYLAGVLSHPEGVKVEVEQCVEQRLEIPERDRLGLGTGKALGVNAVIGRYVPDYSGKLLIRIEGLKAQDYQHLVGDATQWRKLSSLVLAYTGSSLACEVEIGLGAEAGVGVSLDGGPWSGLGLTSWLQQPAETSAETGEAAGQSDETIGAVPAPETPGLLARLRLN